MDQPIPEQNLIPIKEAIFRGRKIEAIKLYRKATGAGLAEAKTAVENRARRRSVAPAPWASSEKRSQILCAS